MAREEYMGLFISESKEHLENLNNALLKLEKKPSDIEAINEIFRSMHTLKGMSASMGFKNINELTHKVEDVLDEMRKGKLEVKTDIVSILFESLDLLEKLLEKVSDKGKDDLNISQVLNKVLKYKGTKKEPSAPSAKSYKISISFDEKCQMKSVRSFIVVKNLRDIGKVIKTTPTVEEMEKESAGSKFDVLFETREEKEKISKLIDSIPEISSVKIVQEEGIKQEEPPAEKKETLTEREEKDAKKVSASQILRVSIERLDNIVNLVGELIINRARLREIARIYHIPELNDVLIINERLMGELQYEVMQIRMVPVDQMFNRLPRIVRDLAVKKEKEVDLIIEGKEIEVDRTILEEINEPMIHLIRNSIDHGIEPPEERIKIDKPKVGKLKVKASREKDHVAIYVEDDGKGIDPKKIREVALKKGVISKEEATRMSDREVIAIIFKPGFSTAEKVTELSGRGVGMDVVKSAIEHINGSVEIESGVGKGTKVTLKLPLTLAIIQALLVNLNTEVYAIPLVNVNRIVDVKPDEIKTVKNQEVVKIYEEVIPLIRISEKPKKETGSVPVVIVEKGIKKAGLVVDRLISQQEIVIKPLGSIFADSKRFAGATILGDGRVALILDTATLIEGG